MMLFPRKNYETPELNVIPLVDILLVLLIFLFLSTSFQRQQILRVQLPSSQLEDKAEQKRDLHLTLAATGEIEVAKHRFSIHKLEVLQRFLTQFSQDKRLLVIHADAQASHQFVIRILEIARASGLERASFVVQNSTL